MLLTPFVSVCLIGSVKPPLLTVYQELLAPGGIVNKGNRASCENLARAQFARAG
ncbi:hypothetical protein PL8927_220081 [Planktothrix serta PCC 8927]|uniref:Uncharacterized protein n=1 Tax=Planktothrix serta PCC 8927 TaxID=671068 RepID=A0A7Z9BJK8_9CYAN|nr:hypothetical protein PL8927_220081 [Planktothrix serta PCC 8927]